MFIGLASLGDTEGDSAASSGGVGLETFTKHVSFSLFLPLFLPLSLSLSLSLFLSLVLSFFLSLSLALSAFISCSHPGSGRRYVSGEMRFVEVFLKLVGMNTPPNQVGENFKVLWPEGTASDMQRILDLRGIRTPAHSACTRIHHSFCNTVPGSARCQSSRVFT